MCDDAENLAGAGTDVRRCSDALGPRKNLHRRTSHGYTPHERASHGRHLTGVYLIGVYLMGVHYMVVPIARRKGAALPVNMYEVWEFEF
jgi:hypothetical protein